MSEYILGIIYDAKYESNYRVVNTIISCVEESGMSLADFVQGLGIVLDNRELSESAALVQQAHRFLFSEQGKIQGSGDNH